MLGDQPMLIVSKLKVGYGNTPVLWGVDIEVYPGETLAFRFIKSSLRMPHPGVVLVKRDARGAGTTLND